MFDDDDEYEFSGLDRAELLLAQLAASESIQYVKLLRVESAASTVFVGRREFRVEDLRPYIVDEESEFEAFDSETQGEEGEPSAPVASAEADVLSRAVGRWIREACAGQMGPDGSEVTFKLDIRGPKGLKCLGAPRVKVRRREDARRGGGELPAVVAPTIPLEPIVAPGPSAGAWAALNAGAIFLLDMSRRHIATIQASYAHNNHMVVASLGEVRAAQAANIRQLSEQNSILRGQIRDRDATILRLTDEMLAFRIDIAEVGLGSRETAASAQVRTETIKAFLDQVGAFGQTWLSTKLGLEPELVAVLQVVRGNPKFVALCKDPRVLRLLSDPAVMELLVETLAGLAASLPPDGTPPTPPNPET